MPSVAKLKPSGRRHTQAIAASSSRPNNVEDRQLWLQICFVRPWHAGTVRCYPIRITVAGLAAGCKSSWGRGMPAKAHSAA